MSDQKLEEEIAYLRSATDDLSDVVARQSVEIERLNRQVAMLLKRAAEQEAQGSGGAIFGDERPPHY